MNYNLSIINKKSSRDSNKKLSHFYGIIVFEQRIKLKKKSKLETKVYDKLRLELLKYESEENLTH